MEVILQWEEKENILVSHGDPDERGVSSHARTPVYFLEQCDLSETAAEERHRRAEETERRGR